MDYSKIHSAPDIYRIVVPFMNVSTSATNCYVVKDGDECLVVDTGAPTEAGQSCLSRALEELCVGRSQVSYFLTHFHLDHAGLVEPLETAGSTLYVGKTEYGRTRPERVEHDAAVMMADMEANGAAKDEVETYLAMLQDSGRYVQAADNPVLVQEGDSVAVGSYRFEVVDTAGHTEGHLALFEPSSRILISGDQMLFVISPSVDRFFDGENGLQVYLRNLEKVKGLGPSAVLHSHGDLRDDFMERIDWLIQHHLDRLDATERIVEANPDRLGVDIIKMVRWNVPADHWSKINRFQRAIIIVQGLVMLDRLVCEGRVSRHTDGDGKVRYRSSSFAKSS